MAIIAPVHPSLIVKEDCLKTLGLTVTDTAGKLVFSWPGLSTVVNGRTAVSAEMACRLSKAFGSTPDHWPRMQLAYGLAQSRGLDKTIRVERVGMGSK